MHGNFSLIISAPHGGSILPSDIPNRADGCFDSILNSCIWTHTCKPKSSKCSVTTVEDYLSNEFAQNVAKELVKIYGLSPFLIIGQWSRKKVDFNREINEATLNHSEGIAGHRSYHNFILDAIAKVKQQFGRGLLLDIHGHSQGNYTMIGYLLTGSELNNDQLHFPTSIEEIIQSSCANNRKECLKGKISFGTIMEKNGLGIAYPSQNNPKPGKEVFYGGGYITQNYIKSINAIQTELPYEIRAGNQRYQYAQKYATAIYQFMTANNLLIKT
ncbi:unnamed protein product [Didymodactylos carnosus]|uniref:N-formylglutamate amidohydrolase n=1 Tax=Didymodactylos carnosus TaxID=1234261 RepID=A0A815C404_9BILA|nr:unnamed protein product [Didymodactylos carnosus]CAF4066358.1 unnamed protein product [Didymodactylos carnosus]